MTGELRGEVVAGPGGVMTDEVGVVTGDLAVVTRPLPGDRASVAVQYVGAEEWYTLTGTPCPVPGDGLAAFHEALLARIREGGASEGLPAGLPQ